MKLKEKVMEELAEDLKAQDEVDLRDQEKLEEALAQIPEDTLESVSADAVATPVPHGPEDIAAQFFKMQQPKLSMILSKLSAKQLRRVIFNAVCFPLVDKQYSPRTQEEKQAAYLVHEMMVNKTIMQLTFEMQKAEEAAKLKEQETKEEVKGEENNGEV